jgi:O-acetyl-ADP-ribose deacetylase (regulator of RNase III)
MLTVHLRDISADVTSAWQAEFAGVSAVHVTCGDILERPADAIASPANSFGYMDGGVDAALLGYFGSDVEVSLRRLIDEQHYGELPVGQAVVLPTGHVDIPFLVSAPTMRVPGEIAETVNVYLAFRAALIALLAHNCMGSPIRTLLVPGMGTGIGQVPPKRAARQMRHAYDTVLGRRSHGALNARQILRNHGELLA